MPDKHTNHSIIYTKHTNHNIIYIKHTDHKSGIMIQIMVQNRDTNSSATQNKDKKIMVQYKHKDTNLEHMNINQLRFSISFSCSLSVKSSLPLFVFREQKNSRSLSSIDGTRLIGGLERRLCAWEQFFLPPHILSPYSQFVQWMERGWLEERMMLQYLWRFSLLQFLSSNKCSYTCEKMGSSHLCLQQQWRPPCVSSFLDSLRFEPIPPVP